MTGIDATIILLFLSGILSGTVRGFVSSIFDLLGIVIGIILASLIYKAPVVLFAKFNIIGDAVHIVFFLLATFILTFAAIVFLDIIRKRVEYKHIIDRALGIFPGAIESIVVITLMLITMSATPNSAKEVQDSKFSKYIIEFLPTVYEKTDQWKIPLPKMIYQPAKYLDDFYNDAIEISFINTNFLQRKNFTCWICGGQGTFYGYSLKVGAAVAPKFTCNNCHSFPDTP